MSNDEFAASVQEAFVALNEKIEALSARVAALEAEGEKRKRDETFADLQFRSAGGGR
ncbi:hypothetical protein [Mycobacterium sp. EPa45]|uniref:hypothetical protein n=1 Tax=Mycobacterium sp. EPa45 TaxID=1545728 RepID=UPI000A470BDC|nr:hypothetical protein [Mycobacterium sp. EPa45]